MSRWAICYLGCPLEIIDFGSPANGEHESFQMLPKQFRLKNKMAFSATYRVKNSSHKGGVTLFAGISKKDADTPTKVGFVVSKKTHKRAVKRNRLKRLMRESYRLALKNNNLGNSQNYLSLVFVGSEHALGKNFAEIQNIINNLIQRLK